MNIQLVESVVVAELKHFHPKEKREMRKILSSSNIQKLMADVEKECKKGKIIFEIDYNLQDHGAFDPESKTPRILLNPNTGLTESNVAHELVHVIQCKKGFPTIPKLYKDKRNEVLKHLCSDILHISLLKELTQREFNIKDYLSPTLIKIRSFLSNRAKNAETSLLSIRSHYEALAYLRIHYEGLFLPDEEKEEFELFFREKAPIAYSIAKDLITIIDQYDVYTSEGSIKALFECIIFLNSKILSEYGANYWHSPYHDMIEIIRRKYPFLN